MLIELTGLNGRHVILLSPTFCTIVLKSGILHLVEEIAFLFLFLFVDLLNDL